MHQVTIDGPAPITPWRVVTLLVIPPIVAAAVCTWWAIDSAAYAYRLYRAARQAVARPRPQ